MRKTIIALGLLATAAAGGFAATSVPPGGGKMAALIAQLDDNASGDDWPGTGRTYDEQFYSPLAQVNDRNVGQLGLAWSVDLGFGNTSTQPVEVDGVVYFSTGMSVVRAVDVRSGKLLWTFDPEVGKYGGKEMRQQWGTRGIAWWNGKVYTGTVDGRLIAIDAKTGKAVWSVKTTLPGQFITGAPRVFKDKVIIGQGGSDSTLNRGYVTAYDAETGKQLWRFYVVPGNPAVDTDETTKLAAKTWTGEWWRWGGGGSPWNAMTYDAELNQVLIGTGNGYPWNQHLRSPGGGDNLFLCSIVAVDADTGAYKWHYQINPGDSWDYNAAMGNALADVRIDGKVRKVLMTAPKNGFFYVIDRTDGKLISAEKIAKVTWATRIDVKTGRPVEVEGARYPDGKDFEIWPSSRGAHSWMPMSYSPKSGLVYIPKIEHGLIFNDRGINMDNWRPFGANLAFPDKDPLDNSSSLLAWDPIGQKKVWEIPYKGGWTGGALSTAGNLVFQGHIDGRLVAYAADSGKELWRFPAQAAILAAPISYRVDGKQYVSVMVGLGGSAATESTSHAGITIDGRTQKNRILTFVLGGKAKLPPAPPPYVVKPVDDPDYKPDPALAAKGEAVYNRNCLNCHGLDTIAAGWAPDLRGSAVPQSAEAFNAIVRDGGLVATGMPRFDDLPEKDIDAVRQYLRSREADLRAGKKETASSKY
jgi:quinohemoprotein ethanol dehydrogenase